MVVVFSPSPASPCSAMLSELLSQAVLLFGTKLLLFLTSVLGKEDGEEAAAAGDKGYGEGTAGWEGITKRHSASRQVRLKANENSNK